MTGLAPPVSVDGRGACGLTPAAKVVCWGENESGQLDVPAGRYAAISLRSR